MEQPSDQPKNSGGGAYRSGDLPRLRDVPPELEYYASRAFTEGVPKYEAGLNGVPDLYPWEKNWTEGDIEFAVKVLDHYKAHNHAIATLALRKLRIWSGREGPQPEPRIDGETFRTHLEHAAANLAMLCFFNELGYFDDPPNPRTNGEILGFRPPAAVVDEVIVADEAPEETVFEQESLSEPVSGLLEKLGLGNIFGKRV